MWYCCDVTVTVTLNHLNAIRKVNYKYQIDY